MSSSWGSATVTYRSIQALRAIAAMAVVLYHIIVIENPVAYLYIRWFQSAVDIFFVISGFIMVVSTQGRSISRQNFIASRIARIVPLYWASLTTYFFILYISNSQTPTVGEYFASMLFIFYRDSITGLFTPFLAPGWSLNYEMLFYALFTVVLSLRTRTKIGVLGLFFAALVCLRPFTPADNALAFRLTSPLPFEFLGGMALAWQRERLAKIAPIVAIPVLVAAIFFLTTFPKSEPRIIFYGVPSVAIVAAFLVAEPYFQNALAARLSILGDSSYSLYLSHVLVLQALFALGVTFWVGNVLLAVPIVLLCIVISIWVYRSVEIPLVRQFKRILPKHGKPAPETAHA